MTITKYLKARREIINQALDRYLPSEKEFSSRIHKAIRYILMSGGKRIRPILAQAAIEALGGNPDNYLKQICSLELIHTYSLIHDDLPAMDNDDFRRGQPSVHKAFDEATAILTGDALLT
ncbi:MAG: polyprenyl synthetase family protein, partial [Thermodesulfobacteriota bacterium]|nr:polyprenyl synthetase family protein [Thermodesulfobacteriota bacterium]